MIEPQRAVVCQGRKDVKNATCMIDPRRAGLWIEAGKAEHATCTIYRDRREGLNSALQKMLRLPSTASDGMVWIEGPVENATSTINRSMAGISG